MSMLHDARRRLLNSFVLAIQRPPLAGPARLRRGDDGIDLTGKRVVLTGASSGIGEAAAAKFARHGAQVVLVSRRVDLLDEAAERIRQAGGDATAMACDLSDRDAVDELASSVQEQLGGCDILVNNAGKSIRRPLLESLERWHDIERTMNLNYYAPLRLIRGLAPGMLERGDGHIINVATWRVMSGSAPKFSAYNASKSALSAISRVIETEWSAQGVHSTTLYYPLVATAMIAPTTDYEGVPALTPGEAADWMITAAKHRPIRIAPRMAICSQAIDTVAPSWSDAMFRLS